jgi:hypothetical protein
MKVFVDHPCDHIISDRTPRESGFLKVCPRNTSPKILPQTPALKNRSLEVAALKFKTTPFFTRLGSDARSNFVHQISDRPKLGNLYPGNPKTAQRFKELFSINFRLKQKTIFIYPNTRKNFSGKTK